MPKGLGVGLPEEPVRQLQELARGLDKAAKRILDADPSQPPAYYFQQDLKQAMAMGIAARVAAGAIAPLIEAGKLEEIYGEALGANPNDVRSYLDRLLECLQNRAELQPEASDL